MTHQIKKLFHHLQMSTEDMRKKMQKICTGTTVCSIRYVAWKGMVLYLRTYNPFVSDGFSLELTDEPSFIDCNNYTYGTYVHTLIWSNSSISNIRTYVYTYERNQSFIFFHHLSGTILRFAIGVFFLWKMKFVLATATLTFLASSAASFSLIDGNVARLDSTLKSTTDLFGKMKREKVGTIPWWSLFRSICHFSRE